MVVALAGDRLGGMGAGPLRVKTRRTQVEQIWSALAQRADYRPPRRNFADGPSPEVAGLRLSREFLEQGLRFLQIAGIEAFGEPVVDRREQFASLVSLASIAPEPRHAHSDAQLERSSPLLAGEFESLNKDCFRFHGCSEKQSEFAFNSEHVGLPEIFACVGYQLGGFSDRAQATLHISCACLQDRKE